MMMELFDFSRDSETQNFDSFKETQTDPFERKSWKRLLCGEGLGYILATFITFALGVTLAIIVHIYVGPREVSIISKGLTTVSVCVSSSDLL